MQPKGILGALSNVQLTGQLHPDVSDVCAERKLSADVTFILSNDAHAPSAPAPPVAAAEAVVRDVAAVLSAL